MSGEKEGDDTIARECVRAYAYLNDDTTRSCAGVYHEVRGQNCDELHGRSTPSISVLSTHQTSGHYLEGNQVENPTFDGNAPHSQNPLFLESLR